MDGNSGYYFSLHPQFHHIHLSVGHQPINIFTNQYKNTITSITMRVTDNLNRDLDLRGEPVNYSLHLRKSEINF